MHCSAIQTGIFRSNSDDDKSSFCIDQMAVLRHAWPYLESFLTGDECGMIRQHTVRNRPQQNGVAERANRILSERITDMLEGSGLSSKFGESV